MELLLVYCQLLIGNVSSGSIPFVPANQNPGYDLNGSFTTRQDYIGGLCVEVKLEMDVLLTSSDADTSICKGDSLVFTASSTIATGYEFFVLESKGD